MKQTKAILVIDMPTVDSLEGLVADIEIKRWIQWGEDKEVCYIGNHRLRPLPSQMKYNDDLWTNDREEEFYKEGWNACIKAITGETE